MNKFERYISTCYPNFKLLVRGMMTLPLKARSLLIKNCQAQINFQPDDNSPIYNLIRQHPDITFRDPDDIIRVTNLSDFLPCFGIDLADPLQSMIVLDLLRCCPLDAMEINLARNSGWGTEISLAETPGQPSTNFSSFFFDVQEPIHPGIPTNYSYTFRIRKRFEQFRAYLIEDKPIYYARAKAKNMSRSTRREAETLFGNPGAFDSFPIFGQDDWQRIYHEHGIEVPGLVEMRQKWYPAQAKPRTYFAMGGTCYRDSRFLQEFFTDLVNLFPVTNHITRLRPSRLRIPVGFHDGHFRIYDLSSFTSNMKEQRSFVNSLREFFRGVPIVVVDECYGPVEIDLGDALDQYYHTCVEYPELSYERVLIDEVQVFDETPRSHARASLLGIFGNLMTCTLAHYLLISPAMSADDEANVAGDDGIILETLLNKYLLDAVIGKVGDCAPDKTMRSNDLGAVALKRPVIETPPSLELLHNIVPPNLAVSISYLIGSDFDPRYSVIMDDGSPLEDRLSVIGKDLMRFLESCYKWGVSDLEAHEVFIGFCRLVEKIVGVFPSAGHLVTSKYVWPLDPLSYQFYNISPMEVYAGLCCTCLDFAVREVEPIGKFELVTAGDEVKGNSSPRLALLERLGYLDKKRVLATLTGPDAVSMWLSLQNSKDYVPEVYQYVCLKDIPPQFIYLDSEL